MTKQGQYHNTSKLLKLRINCASGNFIWKKGKYFYQICDSKAILVTIFVGLHFTSLYLHFIERKKALLPVFLMLGVKQ